MALQYLCCSGSSVNKAKILTFVVGFNSIVYELTDIEATLLSLFDLSNLFVSVGDILNIYNANVNSI
ncbi:hypothetical protein BDB00DRAFT_470750 [Zychaea mexicana]|uniref:uncharacterized protein n=1 Tax=Zychaea mexicana TaxID=64656 RepID=UPI0022FE9294|nr:uncharacterized protein BDB00DRAFT_470750 [Zychaea mexicana]KAI9491927.1 hypothetical protein BDB00DRAFT_470750 [Zychaea mexicana]